MGPLRGLTSLGMPSKVRDMKREAKMYKGCIVAPGSDLWNMLEERQTPDQVKKVEAHYTALDLVYRKSHGLTEPKQPQTLKTE